MRMVPLKEIAPSKAADRQFVPDEVVWQLTLDQIESDTGRIVDKVSAPAATNGSSTYVFDDGNVLYSKLRPYLNKVICPDEAGIATTELVPLRPTPGELDRKYLCYYLRSPAFVHWVSNQVSGAKMPRVNMKVFWKHEIPVPPIDEQTRIAAILDRADAIRRKRAESICLAEDLLKSTFLDMFKDPIRRGRPIETVANMALKERGSIRTGPFGSQLLHSEFVDDGIAVLGIDNAVANEFRWAGRRFITEEKYEGLKRYTVYPGDVLITIMGTCGRCAIVPDDIPTAINTKHLCCITVDREVCLPSYLQSYFLHHPMARHYLSRVTKGAIMDGLNMGLIKEMPIPQAPIDLQRRFASLYGNVRGIRLRLQQSQDECGDLFSSLVQRAFQGEL